MEKTIPILNKLRVYIQREIDYSERKKMTEREVKV